MRWGVSFGLNLTKRRLLMINFSNHLKTIKDNQTLSVIFKTSQILFLISFLFGYKALACPNFPDQIKLSGSSFESETIDVRTSKGSHLIHLGKNNFLSYNENKNCWVLSQQNKPDTELYNDETNLSFTDNKTKQKTGVIKFDNKKRLVSIYSTKRNGSLNDKGPRLVFNETVVISFPENQLDRTNQPTRMLRDTYEYHLTVEAFDKNKLVGRYESISPAPPTRGMDGNKAKMSDLRGKRVVSNGCNLEVKRL